MEAAHIKAMENVSTPTSSGPSSSVSLDTSSSTSVGTIDFKVFPKPFPIPSKWSDSTSKAISSGRMTPHTRKEMIQTLVTLMMVYDQKPSRVRCKQVAIDLIRKYPQLADPLGKAHVSWHNCTVSEKVCICVLNII